jgi:hypothetical protein
LKESLEKFGLVEPIIFNKQTGWIVGGHFRVRELIKLGVKEVECFIVDLNEADEKELNIRLNANTGGWDWDTLANDWDVVDLEAWGLDIPQFETVEELEASEDDYDVAEGGIETDIVIGDLFEIGEHRLLCGDSTDSDAVARLMNGEKADMVFTDPPYNVTNNKWDKFKNDDFINFLNEITSNMFLSMSENSCGYFCLNWRFIANYKLILDDNSSHLRVGTSNYTNRFKTKTSNGNLISYKDSIFNKLIYRSCSKKKSKEIFNNYTNKLIKPENNDTTIEISGYCQNVNLFYEVKDKIFNYLNLLDNDNVDYIRSKYNININDKNIMLGIRICDDFKHMNKINKRSYEKALNNLVSENEENYNRWSQSLLKQTHK